MGKKYIIKLDDNNLAYTAIMIDGVPYIKPLQLLPYTEPDLEQVRKEAYQKGYETGYEDGYNEPGKNQQEAYQRGLNDAWEAASEIAVIPYDEVEKIFGATGWHIFMKCTASEVIEKLKAYEQKQEEIKVGDVVRVKNAPEIEIWVTDISDEDGGLLSGLALKKVDDNCDMGDTYANRNIYNFERTGKHYDVPTVLEKMGEE